MDIRDIIRMLADNVSKTGFPVSVPLEAIYSWAKPLNIPRGKPTAIYTGALYQLIPYINSLVKRLEELEKSSAGGVALRLARVVSGVIDISRLVARPERSEVEWAEGVLTSIAKLLSKAGLDYGYVYEKDLYSGVLLYDLGLDDVFAAHAAKVYKGLKEEGVKNVITVDPHTTYILSKVYPKFVDGFDLEVNSYLEVLAEKGVTFASGTSKDSWVIHDPCFYARHMNIIDPPRRLLERAGYSVVEPKRTRRLTYCCGGPLESVSPTLSKRIAETRMKELAGYSNKIVTLCPICYANLSRVKPGGVVISDIATLLASRLQEG